MKQTDILYDYLRQNGSATGLEIINELGIMNYKGRINDLRKLGVPIETKMEPHISRHGVAGSHARYIFKGEV